MIDINKAVVLNDEPIEVQRVRVNANASSAIIRKGNCVVDRIPNILDYMYDEVISKYVGFTIKLVICTEKECDEIKQAFVTWSKHKRETIDFEKKHGINPKYIQALGDLSVTHQLADTVIPYRKYIDGYDCTTQRERDVKLKKGLYSKSYYCYANKEIPIASVNKLVQHEDGKSAWKCLLQTIGNPTHGIIIRVPKDAVS